LQTFSPPDVGYIILAARPAGTNDADLNCEENGFGNWRVFYHSGFTIIRIFYGNDLGGDRDSDLFGRVAVDR
jgi:hypothetical protein